MKTVAFALGPEALELRLPEYADVLSMSTPEPLADPAAAIQEALVHSIGSPGLDHLIEERLRVKPDARAVVVVSDNTRPVPYLGAAGILWPVIGKLLAHGVPRGRILILVATGTHRPMREDELRKMLDPRVFEAGLTIENHDCRDRANLVRLGRTARGTEVHLNRDYLRADLRILTGLVESHFMAGASGGRKSVCPGLIGEGSTFVFHGAPMLASSQARDLVLGGNPCHEEALEVARMAGADYIVNVTLDERFNLTGVFAGDLEDAHAAAVARLKEYAAILVDKKYDIVLTHAGFVGVNHYQAAKAGAAAMPVLKPGGRLILVANNTDPDPVGSKTYRTVLHLLKLMGAESFNRLLLSPDWTFIPDQWQVQMWARLFAVIPPENLIYFAPQLTQEDYLDLPCMDGNHLLEPGEKYRGDLAMASQVVQRATAYAIRNKPCATIAVLADGPYGIPVHVEVSNSNHVQ